LGRTILLITGECRELPVFSINAQTSETHQKTMYYITKYKRIEIGQQNHRTLHRYQKQKCVCSICLQETWRTGNSNLEHDGCVILNSGLDPGAVKSRRGEQGVGIALSKSAVAAWKSAGSYVVDDCR